MTIPQQSAGDITGTGIHQQAAQAAPAMQPPRPAPPPEPVPYVITPQPGSRLDDLLARRKYAAAQLEAALEAFETLDASIKTELTALAPKGTAIIDVPAAPGREPLRLGWGARKKFRRTDFDRDYPGVYERYQAWGRGFWGWRKAA